MSARGKDDVFGRMPAKVSIDAVDITYRTDRGVVTAVQDVTLRVGAGEFLTIVGPSGCGKSTLLKALGGLIPHSAGTIDFDGARAEGQSAHAIVFQEPRLLPWRTTLGNVVFPLEKRGIPAASRTSRAMTELRRVGLGAFVDRYPQQLSGGMQQRVNLARALAVDPEILLLDEPFAALDAQTREHMQQELLRIWETHRKTALFVTHQVDEAVFLADRVVVFSRAPGTVKMIYDVPFERPRDLRMKRTKEFHELEDAIWSSIDVVRDEFDKEAQEGT